MVFDGRTHDDARLIYPINYHPKAPLTGGVLGQALESAYFCALNSGAQVIDQNYPITWRDPDGFRDRMTILASAAGVRVAEGFRYIPPQATHLVGQAIFSIFDATEEASAYHRLFTYGGTTRSGADTETRISVPSDVLPTLEGYSRTADPTPNFIRQGKYTPYGPSENTFKAQFEMVVVDVANADLEIYVEAYTRDRANAAALSYFPQRIVVWWESRS